jgi:hypothetical protein
MSVLQRGAWVHYLPNIATILVYPATQSPTALVVYKSLPIETKWVTTKTNSFTKKEKELFIRRLVAH